MIRTDFKIKRKYAVVFCLDVDNYIYASTLTIMPKDLSLNISAQ